MAPVHLPPPSTWSPDSRGRTNAAVPGFNFNSKNPFGQDAKAAKARDGERASFDRPPAISAPFDVTRDLPNASPCFVREYAHQRDPSLGETRSDFTETVYWHPALVQPQSGKQTIEFQLADDVARYQVIVAGHTLNGRIGAITTTIEARKPFSIDPKLPLEIAHTDRIDVPVRVTNDSDDSRNISIALTPAGLTADRSRETLALGPNGKDRRIFRLTPNKLEGAASLTVEAASLPGRDTDAITRSIRGRELILYWRGLEPDQKIALSIDLICDVPGSYRGPASRAYLYYNADYKHWVEPLGITIAPIQGIRNAPGE